MSLSSKPPPMAHSDAYYESRSIPSSSQIAYQYPPTVPLQHPSPAHVNPTLHPRPYTSTHRTDPNRPQGSVSSGESGSTAESDFKPYLHKQTYLQSPQLERGQPVLGGRDHTQPYYAPHIDTRIPSSNHGPSEMIEDQSAVYRYIQQHQAEEEEYKEDDHALWILMWMSFLDPFYCLFSAIFTLFSVLVIIVMLPFRLCQKDASSSTTLIRLVGPVFRNHLQMIYAQSLDFSHTFEFSPSCLVFIQVISPILSMGNAIAAWVVAVFWIFAIIMGNPDGTEKRDDGRATVLMLRDWWEKCLLYAIRK
ncbi:hypothetical protein B0A52_08443 [Exophiala mesophila]|uniref:Uncharacterized protein n=1 Tax=Exophiala mesophila TaxID=212818 RepID=A0A438MWA4_EXOME|nr:hypothetical protein B0A52_08443 [Exophiala mesophila]